MGYSLAFPTEATQSNLIARISHILPQAAYNFQQISEEGCTNNLLQGKFGNAR